MNELAAADAYCRTLTLRHYENFTVASRFVPADVRVDLMRFYGFCRTTDDLGDESGSTTKALSRLERWKGEVQELFDGGAPVHPVLVALRQTVARRRLDSKPFVDLIAANEQDQRVHSYEAWPELEAYCMLSAAPVGRVVLRIFGVEDARAQGCSDDVCIGLQLANHAQDVSRDAVLGRSYLLEEDLRASGAQGAVKALVDRARTLLASGRTLEGMVAGALRVQLALYRLGGLAICDAIARDGYRTQVKRPSVSKGAKVAILAKALIEGMQRRHEVVSC